MILECERCWRLLPPRFCSSPRSWRPMPEPVAALAAGVRARVPPPPPTATAPRASQSDAALDHAARPARVNPDRPPPPARRRSRPRAAAGGMFSRPGLMGGLAAGFLGAGLFGLLFGQGLFYNLGGLAAFLGLLLQIGLVALVGYFLLNHPGAAAVRRGAAYSGDDRRSHECRRRAGAG